MNLLTTFCWLGSLAFFVTNLHGQRPDEGLHDLEIGVENAIADGFGMGGGGHYDPSRPDGAGNLVVRVVNNSKRDLIINPKHVRICARGQRDLKLNGVPFLYDDDVTVPAGKSLDIMKVPLLDILDPTRLKSQRTISWQWWAHPSPPTSPIMPNEKDYANVGVFWVEHTRDRHVLRSRPLVIPVTNAQSR